MQQQQNDPGYIPPPGPPEDISRSRPSRRSKLPLILGGGIGLALICAGGFFLYSLFIYQPEIPLNPPAGDSAATDQEMEVVKFNTDDSSTTPTEAPTPEGSTQSGENPPSDAQSQPPQDESPSQTETATDADGSAEPPETEAPPQPPSSEVPAPVPPGGPAGPAQMTSPDFGIQAFLYWRPEVAARDLQLIKDINFRWVKQQIAWRDIEGAGKGVYDWEKLDRVIEQVNEKGLNLIARVDLQPEWAGGGYPEIGPPDNYQDFADFLTALASRYQGRIKAYQIWNEPNLAREWGNRPPNPAEYTALLRLSYQTIKAIEPDALIITAGLAPTTRWDDVAMPDTVFVQGMYDAGAQPHFDALGVHGAGYKVSPGTDPSVVANDPALNNNDPSPPDLKRIYAFRHIEDVRAVMERNNDAAKRVVVLEFGWSVDPRPDSPYHWHAVSEAEQARYIVDAYRYAQNNWQPWIGVMSLIYLANVDWTEADEQTYWSITHPEYPEFKARPAYWGLLERADER